MDGNIVTLIVGLSGIIATLIASGLGLYFTAKARSENLRQTLFSNQLELVIKIIHKQSRIRNFAIILSDNDDTFKKQARDDIGECIREFSEFQERAAAILPTELWIEIKYLNDEMTQMLADYDGSKSVTKDHLRELAARETKVALLSRAVIGTDELTEQSMKLFSEKNSLKRLANIEIDYFRKLGDRSNP